MIGNVIVWINLVCIHLWCRDKLIGRPGPEAPSASKIKLGIDAVTRNIESIKAVPSFRMFLVACLFHRQAVEMFADLIVPVLDALKVNSTIFNVGAVSVFLTRGFGAPLW